MKPRFPRLRFFLLAATAASLLGSACFGAADEVRRALAADLSFLEEFYRDLHANPELSLVEYETAAKLAARLREAGFEVTEGIGGTGVVGVLRNGPGPTILLRTDLDGLPVREETGLPYASTRTARDREGQEVFVMHACGHDVHMAAFIGAARRLAAARQHWSGTLVMIGQPAEELGLGALAMLEDGLFERFPLPDYALAGHVNAALPSGTIGIREGFSMANVDTLDITLFGQGGHGAYPHTTIDPIVLAGQVILGLQTIVSREIPPTEAAVVTIGSIQGGTKHNIIPNEVKLQLTIRSYSDETREKLLGSIRRIVTGLARTAGVPSEKEPVFTLRDIYTPAVYNQPELVRRASGAMGRWLGAGKIVEVEPAMGGEDFGRYGRTDEGIPIFLYWIGGVEPQAYAASLEGGPALPSLHSSRFAPDARRAIETGVLAMVAAVLELAPPR